MFACSVTEGAELSIPFVPIGASDLPIVGATDVTVPTVFSAQVDNGVDPPFFIYKQEDAVLTFDEFKLLMGYGVTQVAPELPSYERMSFGGLQPDGSFVFTASTNTPGVCALMEDALSAEVPEVTGTLWLYNPPDPPAEGAYYAEELTLDHCASILRAVHPSATPDYQYTDLGGGECDIVVEWSMASVVVGVWGQPMGLACTEPAPTVGLAENMGDLEMEAAPELMDEDANGDIVAGCALGYEMATGECVPNDWSTIGGSLSADYEGDPTCPGTSGCSETPTPCIGAGGCIVAGTGPAAPADPVDICVEHPDILACEEVDLEGAAEDLAGVMEDYDLAQGDLEDIVTDLNSDITSYTLGDGPELMAPVSVCPLVAPVEAGLATTVLTPVYEQTCEIAGGPIRIFMLALGLLASVMILLRSADR